MQKTLSQLLDDTERERARKEMSADEPGIRKKLREEIYDEMPGEDLRPHAPKMELRIHEHEALELVSLDCQEHCHLPKLVNKHRKVMNSRCRSPLDKGFREG